MSTAAVARRVAAGAAWLDETYPGWDAVIDLDRLMLKSGELCVLGQIGQAIGEAMGCYVAVDGGLMAPDPDRPGDDLDENGFGVMFAHLPATATALGFSIGEFLGSPEWDELDAVWHRLIADRQGVPA